MDAKQVIDALKKLFETERIVFWNDYDKDFIELITGKMFSPLENVSVIRLDHSGSLHAKIRIEQTEPNTKFLVYSPAHEPEDPQLDWLLDIRLYSRCFYADRGSLDVEALGLKSVGLREHLNQRRKFLDNKERFSRLKTLISPDDNAEDIDKKMLAVVTKADQAEPFNIIRSLLHSYTELPDVDLREPSAVWEAIDKYDLQDTFWKILKRTFGYSEDHPSLENLTNRLYATDFVQQLHQKVPVLENLLLPVANRSNCTVFMAQWRDSATHHNAYDALSEYVADKINLGTYLHSFEIERLIDVQTFAAVEKEIARGLRDRVIGTADTINVEDIRSVSTRRQSGHWASLSIQGTAPRKELHNVYEALVKAAEFFELKNKYQDGFDYGDAKEMYSAYAKELYRFDQLYRLFCEHADACKAWNVLKVLREQIEAIYTNWYITNLGLTWGKFLEGGLLDAWSVSGIPNQYSFYTNTVKSRLGESDNRRVFVIISDAFRYEAAVELMGELNGKYRITADLTSQLGVLPSYTALGMASLLPHKTLTYDPKGNVLVDDKPSSSLEQRNAILRDIEGIALKADDFLSLKKEEGRDAVAGKKVVYIYHDAIDSIGDKASTEGDVFGAVRKAIDELGSLVRYILNNLNGTYIVVTADHGFLFSETAPAEHQKSKLEEKPDGTVLSKKRYLLGRRLPTVDEAYHGTTSVSAKATGDMEYWIPKIANKFHFSGGSRFVHGGAMPQEIVVPVLTVRQSLKDPKPKHVDVQILGVNHRITTPKYRFQLLQTEPVSDKVKSTTLKIAIYENEDAVTNIESITFDSDADNIEMRTKQVVLVLEERSFNKKTQYRLVLRDAKTDIEQSSLNVVIDRTFSDDF